MSNDSPVWFITGASSGFGQLLALRALQAGHRVIGSVRNKSRAAGPVNEIESAGGKIVELDMTESQASIQSAASIASLDIEQTRTTTGITLDDIHQFIQGPEPADNQWVCVYEGCNKRFGRKENIKSHVQTHLNDRQYQCPSCQKCFVRQHDLKRHARLHTGERAHTCDKCGRQFARGDTLARHNKRCTERQSSQGGEENNSGGEHDNRTNEHDEQERGRRSFSRRERREALTWR